MTWRSRRRPELQVEEEKNASLVVAQLQRVGDSPAALLMLDQQLGQRT